MGEIDETFFLELDNPSGNTLLRSRAEGTIVNDDALLSIADADVIEGDADTPSTMRLTVTMSDPAADEVSFRYRTVPTSLDPLAFDSAEPDEDFTPVDAVGTFAPGQTELVLEIPVVGDDVAEAAETFDVVLSHIVGGFPGDVRATARIDNDDLEFFAGDRLVVEGDEPTRDSFFRIGPRFPINREVSFDYETVPITATPDVDYVPLSGSAVVPAGRFGPVIVIDIIGDTIGEGDESFAIRYSNVVGGDPPDLDFVITIRDNDPVIPAITEFRLQRGNTSRARVNEFSFAVTDNADLQPAIDDGTLTEAITLVNLGIDADSDDDVPIELSAAQFTFATDGDAPRLIWNLGDDADSLPDGNYRLALDGDAILIDGEPLDADGDGIPGGRFTADFHRLAGDVDGDASISGSDVAVVNESFGGRVGVDGFNPDADVDGDGRITSRDRIAVRTAANRSLVAAGSVATGRQTLPQPLQTLDATNDGRVDAIDALAVLNQLRRTATGSTDDPSVDAPWQYDTDLDGDVTPLDALVVLNQLRRDRFAADPESVRDRVFASIAIEEDDRRRL